MKKSSDSLPTHPLEQLLAIMSRLRDAEHGCPWDLAQDFQTIVPHTIEEAYEVADAIAVGDFTALEGELGDLLFQVVFYAQLAKERGLFDLLDIIKSLNAKMMERHPHIFGTAKIETAMAQTQAWETHKAEERRRKAEASGRRPSALDGVLRSLPALIRAEKLQKRAASQGFDWQDVRQVLLKVVEEHTELEAEIASGGSVDASNR